MKIPIIIWIYWTEVWFDILPKLQNNNFRLQIGLCIENDNCEIIKSIEENFNDYTITYFPNLGYDIFPFLQELNNISEPFFIKIHTKKDNDWRSNLIDPIFSNIESNINYLENKTIILPWNKVINNDIGMLASKNLIVSNYEFTNTDKIKHLCEILNIDYNKVKNSRFVSGTMFMAKTSIFKKYFNTENLNVISKLIETSKVDDKTTGTYTHALERIFGYIITNENMRIKSII